MAYAHWEGYGKATIEAYTKVLLRRKPRFRELSDALATTHIRQAMKRLNSGDPTADRELLAFFRGQSDPRLRISTTQVVDTKSNLRFATLQSMLKQLGIEYGDFETKRHLIDKQLCDGRNEVAHGRGLFPQSGAVITLCDDVIEMMETLRTLLRSAVSEQRYLLQQR